MIPFFAFGIAAILGIIMLSLGTGALQLIGGAVTGFFGTLYIMCYTDIE